MTSRGWFNFSAQLMVQKMPDDGQKMSASSYGRKLPSDADEVILQQRPFTHPDWSGPSHISARQIWEKRWEACTPHEWHVSGITPGSSQYTMGPLWLRTFRSSMAERQNVPCRPGIFPSVESGSLTSRIFKGCRWAEQFPKHIVLDNLSEEFKKPCCEMACTCFHNLRQLHLLCQEMLGGSPRKKRMSENWPEEGSMCKIMINHV